MSTLQSFHDSTQLLWLTDYKPDSRRLGGSASMMGPSTATPTGSPHKRRLPQIPPLRDRGPLPPGSNPHVSRTMCTAKEDFHSLSVSQLMRFLVLGF